MKNSYANTPRSLHPLISSVLLPSTPSTTVPGLQSLYSRPKEMRGCRAPYSHRAPAFTIVELLIVIVVIGILAAISIVAYVGITNSANDAAIKSDLKNAMDKLAQYEVSAGVSFVGFSALPTALEGFSVTPSAYASGNNFIYCTDSATSIYGFGSRSKSGKSFIYNSQSGLRELGSVLPESGGGDSGACALVLGRAGLWSWGRAAGGWMDWASK